MYPSHLYSNRIGDAIKRNINENFIIRIDRKEGDTELELSPTWNNEFSRNTVSNYPEKNDFENEKTFCFKKTSNNPYVPCDCKDCSDHPSNYMLKKPHRTRQGTPDPRQPILREIRERRQELEEIIMDSRNRITSTSFNDFKIKYNFYQGFVENRQTNNFAGSSLGTQFCIKMKVFEKGRHEDGTCNICLCDYEDGDYLRILKCKHKFHRDCVDKWLEENIKCPVCRSSI